ncbi:hypothetical protein R4Y45_04090 [Holzapfeliella sp. He02]|uniref:Uncharacterized protein n=1 Tax=Holzapfeliella saturejae TaxID=3082953 RepID=A0ABU8SI90_9LACO
MKNLKIVSSIIIFIVACVILYNLFSVNNSNQQQLNTSESTMGVDLDSTELGHQNIVNNTTDGLQPYHNGIVAQQHQSSFGSTVLNYMLISSLLSNRFNTYHNPVNYPRYNQNVTTNSKRTKQSSNQSFSDKIIKNSKKDTAQKSTNTKAQSKSYKTDTKSYKQPSKSYKSNPKSYKTPKIKTRR